MKDLANIWYQKVDLPAKFNEADIGPIEGKVVVVTGVNSK